MIAGDLNADPLDGDSTSKPIELLLQHPRINGDLSPRSEGGIIAMHMDGGVNGDHLGDPANDTGDFNDQRTGNLRIDYVLPSKSLTVKDCGSFGQGPDKPGGAARPGIRPSLGLGRHPN